ncbi:TauD/TfdA dioxygenase family protein [Paraburkholderia caballeronis]|uniref:TauD/TfdA dioxygenase family protein n=1 Tax=Paraburkholderia caballeronis TaxID=416943 RepID=UPI001066EF43|nr:TauD/TfdA family dioxygenase [Paraburkholderia caballeronis]TDV19599.1 alpha-ketoglutarate-dependent 2,4-dichlorophenoxyacetate dioxygenase [Paraburkholderia caballeronis]TDV22199.1 alpha-ketoglutarate-dependent 2,4-dichlorophenoxyacetate dioxygenase [Paraburkholderia caballeronis]TDV29103.1 alpha-ketoglutarate-dependent 2,4-dichlorophenoxyacetate dioxygenase [Paraburkholderia caballeronis]
MKLEIEPFPSCLGAEVRGIDLSQPLTGDNRAAIEAAIARHAVLVFRGQPLSQDAQVALARGFGPLDLGLKRVKKTASRFRHDELLDISNVDTNGEIAARDTRRIVGNLANQLWHSDSSFQKPAARYSMLSAIAVAPQGGDTEFCDLRAAWDALPEDWKREIEGREAVHYALHSRFVLGDTDYTEAQRAELPPVTWPLVRTHPDSQRKLLFVGAHASEVVGMTLAEGRMLLMDLLEHVTQREFVYVHKWQPGDLVMWDNRSTLHRGRRYDLSIRREMRRTTTLDVDGDEQAATSDTVDERAHQTV